MAKSRNKVQQVGFWDEEVPSTGHDEIVLWCHQHAERILRSIRPSEFDRAWKPEDVEESLYRAHVAPEVHAASLQRFMDATPRPNPQVTARQIEAVLRSYTGYGNRTERVVGFADLLVTAATPWVGTCESSESDFGGHELRWNDRAISVLVEAKSVLPTFGELMRQLNLYRTAFSGLVVVVSPDDRFEDVLRDQRIHFFKYGAAVA